ncbi:hypothetical protein IE077_004277 [Cardiosporidium cionae]|uniref:Uncharacterized protein n=1 Tax=Cardiosporidium cionae TaxID=476202 RepID=A0ABQ7J423_9APIC|nr:hypothetical protein IE077_004277 [Cardiosporidium cionae]|eukprot:KAF8817779.1 hypothetical protein IE077_004277 [Cardiosporidium cionae]
MKSAVTWDMVSQCRYSSHTLHQARNYFYFTPLVRLDAKHFHLDTTLFDRIQLIGKYDQKTLCLPNDFYSKFFHSAVYNRLASWSWWDLYVRGECPDYPPRKRAFEYLSSKGVDVMAMQISEIELFMKWLETKRLYQKPYPQFPYETLLEDKVTELLRKYPLE